MATGWAKITAFVTLGPVGNCARCAHGGLRVVHRAGSRYASVSKGKANSGQIYYLL